MEALFTETLEDLLKNQGYGTASQTQSLTEILSLMEKFPDFDFRNDDLNVSFSMKNLFIDKYDIREIGAETEALFMHFWKERTQQLVIEYTPKISMWLNHFNDLFKFTVQLTETEEINKDTSNTRTDNLEENYSESSSKTLSSSLDKKYYLNPINTNLTNLKIQEANALSEQNTDTLTSSNTTENTGTVSNSGEEEITREKTRDVLQSVWGKTRATLLKQIFELQSVYSEALMKFEDLFMGVL